MFVNERHEVYDMLHVDDLCIMFHLIGWLNLLFEEQAF